ncbi:hypothetical protein FKR81_40220 [Lentzea tibetensis]|uniref:Uncharacterized protein n=1 Tax=Lentzea tibetensis TaxID=2591470 RepID=A0A563EFW9_9PSEU|nr:DUF6585 family protein [Lentzea tibetensis]TWP44990.1 hypothetical protein FKR81_40220 [Lentzea tibetensis]
MSKKRGPWARLTPLFIMIALGAGLASVWAWPAYTYKFGERVMVSYTGPCETTYGRRGGSTTDCPATWTVDGVEVSGELTDSVGEDIRDSSDGGAMVTSVWGSTARTQVQQPEYGLGLAGPWVLLASVALAFTSSALDKRRTRRRIAQGLEDPNADPLDLADTPDLTPELLALERRLGRPVAEYTSRAPIGWLLFGGVLFFPLGYSLFQGIETVFEYLVALAGAGAMVWGTIKIRRRKAWRATFFDNGVHVRQDKRIFTCGWQEVTAVLAAVTIQGATKRHKYTVWRNSEESYVFDDDWSGIDELGQRLVRDANQAMLPRYVESFDAGVALKFADLVVNRDGLSVGNQFVPWGAVTHFALSNGMVEIRAGGVHKLQAVADTPNVPILLALANAARKRVTRVE